MSFNFGRVQDWVLFGRGILVLRLAQHLLKKSKKIIVICGKRNLEEILEDGISFEKRLKFDKIPFIVSADVNKDRGFKSKITKYTAGISLDAPWIFKSDIINLFNGKLVNSHGARLPQDRGGGGFSWRILRNERTGFSLIHQVDKGVDTGDIIKYKEYFYPSSCRLPIDYMNFSLEQDLQVLKELVQDIEQKRNFSLIGQANYLGVYWPRLHTDTHGYINWSWKRGYLENFICAFDDPYNGAITFINGIKVRIKKCFSTVSDGVFHPFQSGIVYRKSKEALFVSVEDGSLIIHSVTSEDGNNLSNKIKTGDRFYTPEKYLQEAKEYRAFYTSEGLKK